jgi:hypothetical protein
VVAPVETVVAPVETVATPVETVVAPVETVVAPVETVVAPVETVVAPVETVASQFVTRQTFVEVVQDVAHFKTQGFIGDLEINQVLASNGLADITLLAARPDLVPVVSAQLNASIKV